MRDELLTNHNRPSFCFMVINDIPSNEVNMMSNTRTPSPSLSFVSSEVTETDLCDQENSPSLHLSCFDGNLLLARQMILEGANLNQKDRLLLYWHHYLPLSRVEPQENEIFLSPLKLEDKTIS
jgi:hypothetical protein